MSEYEIPIEGTHKLEGINSAIAGEEAGASEFKSSTLKVSGTGEISNSVTFSELPPGTIPKPLTIVKQSDSQPPGTKKVWSGAMVVEGKTIAVVAYREV